MGKQVDINRNKENGVCKYFRYQNFHILMLEYKKNNGKTYKANTNNKKANIAILV